MTLKAKMHVLLGNSKRKTREVECVSWKFLPNSRSLQLHVYRSKNNLEKDVGPRSTRNWSGSPKFQGCIKSTVLYQNSHSRFFSQKNPLRRKISMHRFRGKFLKRTISESLIIRWTSFARWKRMGNYGYR